MARSFLPDCGVWDIGSPPTLWTNAAANLQSDPEMKVCFERGEEIIGG
jgi:hypothetical protein